MDNREERNGMSRRELLGRFALIGLMASAGGTIGGDALAQTTGKSNPDYEALRKVLVERLLNTRYYFATDGSIVVLPRDEVWPGDTGGAYHADWLFNTVDGLKANPNAALEQTIITDIVHEGIPSGWDLTRVSQIINSAEAMGLLDDFNLIYQVLREKIHVETHGAHEYGVKMFQAWIQESAAYSQDQKDIVDRAAVDYLSRPIAQDHHDYY